MILDSSILLTESLVELLVGMNSGVLGVDVVDTVVVVDVNVVVVLVVDAVVAGVVMVVVVDVVELDRRPSSISISFS